jgi:poly-gamma-glutamate system protein
MKKIYWTANKSHPVLMFFMCLIAIGCLVFVETHKKLVPQDNYEKKLEAAELSKKAFHVLKRQRLKLGLKINKKHDPSKSGLIGRKESKITSDHGVLRSKQISVNPNLAALILQWMIDLKLKEGDYVAVGMTGSFPAIDTSTLAALSVLKLKPILIVSAAASQWGANLPDYSWLDMLNTLNQAKVLDIKPIAASLGSNQDLGSNLEPGGVKTLLDTIKRYNIPLIKEPVVSLSINERLKRYKEAANGGHIKAYINIGGGIASIGKHFAKSDLSKEEKAVILKNHLKTGVNLQLPISLANSNSVAIRFLKQGIPVINIKDIALIAEHYNLSPWRGWMGIGVGPLFFHEKYNIWYALISLLIIIGVCWVEMRLQVKQKKAEASEQLI